MDLGVRPSKGKRVYLEVEDLVFPDAISEQKYSSKLKDLASLAGIAKNLMNKIARHSAIQF